MQEAAGGFKKRGEEIPQGLVDMVNVLAGLPSGFPGLSVHQAFIGMYAGTSVKRTPRPDD